MRKLKLQVQTSIDNFIAGVNGEMDWLSWNWDEELNNHVSELTETVELILLGRKLAQTFMQAWESRFNDPETSESARKMVETQKIVFTKTLESIEGQNVEISNGDLVEEVTKLKNSEGGDIIVYGGASFVSALVKNNLIDEYNLFVNPVALGKGMSIFGEIEGNLKLDLIAAKSFECGITSLQYERKND